MFVIGLGTAVPPWRYTQQECYQALQESDVFAALTLRSRALLRKVLLGANGIEMRHFALAQLRDGFDLRPDTLHARFVQHAPALAARAAERALAEAGCTPRDIDALLISTCTGYLCPGLTSYVAQQLGLRPNAHYLDLVGQGCGAALPNLAVADALLASERAQRVLSICVEICTAAIYFDDDPGVLVSACLFGDGAAAVVASREPRPNSRRIEWKQFRARLAPGDRDQLRFEHRNGVLRNRLTLAVPRLASVAVEQLLEEMLARQELSRDQLRAWIFHAGGRDVLTALRLRLRLRDDDLRWSTAVLREYGNMSSPSVLFALQRAWQAKAPEGWWWMASFGAGFSAYGALLEVS